MNRGVQGVLHKKRMSRSRAQKKDSLVNFAMFIIHQCVIDY